MVDHYHRQPPKEKGHEEGHEGLEGHEATAGHEGHEANEGDEGHEATAGHEGNDHKAHNPPALNPPPLEGNHGHEHVRP